VLLSSSGSPYPQPLQTLVHPAGALITVNSAYGTYAIAPEAVASIYGSNLATQTLQAPPASQQLPTSLGGVSVSLKDANGGVFPVGLYLVSPNQVNCVIPNGVASGVATLTLTNPAGTLSGTAVVGATAPGLYTANSTGQGPAAAQVTNGGTYFNTFQCPGAGACTMTPINLAATPYLILYGTGIRGGAGGTVSVKIGNLDSQVLYAGAQGTYPGLDQVNVALPAALKGRGQQVVAITVNGQASNMAQLTFQ
jgi:uncharacterized protein (TIGR03437 family)